ncbi:hypothetical protein X801_08164, partial [Opisthorchis viverrini]
MTTHKLMCFSYLLLMLMGLLRSTQACEPIPAENRFREQCLLGGLQWETQDLSAMLSTPWYMGVGIDFCKEHCKSQPSCFGFNWLIIGSSCQLDDTGGSHELMKSVVKLYNMKCC